MPKKWITIAVVALIGYFLWRKFGGRVTSAVTDITK